MDSPGQRRGIRVSGFVQWGLPGRFRRYSRRRRADHVAAVHRSGDEQSLRAEATTNPSTRSMASISREIR